MGNLFSNPVVFIFSIIAIFFSIILHEVAHGWVAERCGDPTARMAGRITLNPLPHIDLMGTIVLPLALILLRSNFILGWAKPVPVNFYRLRHPKRDTILVSIAGIMTNLSLAVLGGLIFRLFGLLPYSSFALGLEQLLFTVVEINLVLAIFNLIPIPPLDGSKVLAAILPPRWEAIIFGPQAAWIGMILLFILLYTGLLGMLLGPVINGLLRLLLF
jgi:Zn-dependent protease